MSWEKRKRRILTKTVPYQWYRRYAKVLDYDERVYYQPLREIREEARMLKALETPPNPNVRAAELSKQLIEARKLKIKIVLQILEGNFKKFDLSSLKPSTQNPLSALSHRDVTEQVQTLFWRQRAIRPQGYVLSPKSKWRLFWENPIFMEKFHGLILEQRSAKIRARWVKALRLFQSIYRFNRVLADIAGATDDVFKKFKTNKKDHGFQKNHFKASAVGKNLDSDIMFTLSKPEHYRNLDEAREAAKALRVMHTFAEFPKYMQDKICEIAWYLELDKDKMIIREGHMADSFYFLLAGRVASIKMEIKHNHSSFRTLNNLTMGALIGAEGFDGQSYREYSVITLEKCKVIAINLDDFHRKCFEGETPDDNPGHICFLSQLSFMRLFPMQEMIDNAENNILLFYFNLDTIVTRNVAQSPYIYVVYKGSCKVLGKVAGKNRLTRRVHMPPKLTEGSSPHLDHRSTAPLISKCGKEIKTTRQSIANARNSWSPNKTMESVARACDKRTIAESIKKEEGPKEDQPAINLNLASAASIEMFVGRKSFVPPKLTEPCEWIQLQVLREGDVIGLEGLDLGDTVTKSPARFDVVSEGAQVIMILKTFFMEYISDEMKMDLRASSYIHPDEAQLKTELERRSAWRRFQNGVMEEMYGRNGKKRLPPI